jgi:ubiquinone/menaquinone biosynthesis C-methylase UbiE
VKAATRKVGGYSTDFIARRYDRLASIYRLLSGAFLLRPQIRHEMIDSLELQSGATVLEVGCGTGNNFEALVERVGPAGRVIGVDASAGMLQRAEALRLRHGWTNVTLLRQDASQLQIPGPLDAVLFSLSYSVLPNRRRTLSDAWHLLVPGGRMVIMDAGVPDGRLGRLLAMPLRVISGATVLGDPLVRPWKDLESLAEEVEFRRLRPGTYHLSAATYRH